MPRRPPKPRLRRLDPRAIVGAMCGWRGCQATFTFRDHPPDAPPEDWQALCTLTGSTLVPLAKALQDGDPPLVDAAAFLRSMDHDVLLCPLHAETLARLLNTGPFHPLLTGAAPPAGAAPLRALIDEKKREIQAREDAALLDGDTSWHAADALMELEIPTPPYDAWAARQVALVRHKGAEQYFALLAARLERFAERQALGRRRRPRRPPP